MEQTWGFQVSPTHSVALGKEMPFPLYPQLSQKGDGLDGSMIYTHTGVFLFMSCVNRAQSLGIRGFCQTSEGLWSAAALEPEVLALTIPFASPPRSLNLFLLNEHYVCPCAGDGLR